MNSMNLKNLKKKLRLIRFILSHDEVKSISEEQNIRGIIISSLARGLKIENVENHFHINAITDEIVSQIYNKTPLEERFKTSINSQFEQNMWYFSIVSGYASLWELKVKLLAEKLGIEVKKPKDNRSKHHKKNKIMTYRDLKPIISDISKKIHPNFNLSLNTLNELRSSLIHGNLDQLRIIANNFSHDYKKEHQGNLFVFTIEKPNEGTNLSKNLTKEEEKREDQNIFAWFLEITNSSLLREVWNIFEKSVMQIVILTEFDSFSYDERRKLFEKVVFEGEKITPSMIDKYSEILKPPLTQNKDFFFNKLQELFGAKIFSNPL